jgi:hypothetical protein
VSEDVALLGVIILGSMIGGWILAAVVMYITAQIDERKWRKRAVGILAERRDHG